MRKLLLGLIAVAMLIAPRITLAGELPPVTVWKSPTCGCCGKWVEHMRKAGFKVTVKNMDSMDMVKRMAGVRDELQSCHTARVGGYTIEGHVPAADVQRLLSERPNVLGLAVPGMPSGSPGMENGERDPYDVLAFTASGSKVFSSHR